MTQHIKAIYENGVLRPLQPLQGVADHARVDVTVNTSELSHSSKTCPDMDVRACIGTLSDKDAAEMTRIIADEFEKVDERDW